MNKNIFLAAIGVLLLACPGSEALEVRKTKPWTNSVLGRDFPRIAGTIKM